MMATVLDVFYWFLRFRVARCGNLLRCILRYFFDPLCNRCVGLGDVSVSRAVCYDFSTAEMFR